MCDALFNDYYDYSILHTLQPVTVPVQVVEDQTEGDR